MCANLESDDATHDALFVHSLQHSLLIKSVGNVTQPMQFTPFEGNSSSVAVAQHVWLLPFHLSTRLNFALFNVTSVYIHTARDSAEKIKITRGTREIEHVSGAETKQAHCHAPYSQKLSSSMPRALRITLFFP